MQRARGVGQQVADPFEIDEVIGVAAVGGAAARRDQAGPAQQAEVVGNQVLRVTEERGQLVHLPVAAGQLAQQLPAQWMRGKTQELQRRHVAHFTSRRFDVKLTAVGAATPTRSVTASPGYPRWRSIACPDDNLRSDTIKNGGQTVQPFLPFDGSN